ncbi:alpha-ketoglutarate-dependent dioxygenase AlkB [Zhouia spongiae]|uniref:Alpha-ketoglutarate-dependent dioxygenase AlkB n=1 Tax=Zhouia spongiae TaxID=2202721 RepID=A0ABY3YIT3_9FLAO|nr:alpha-ketoglutarate-dependent dioxygenase AlkB [Zhouia spongiae]UNY97517.1 alpha-ketoglutarate-dependent dioxygenase AlkB [Zhouia spongiae]
MDLFSAFRNPEENILPYDGTVNYYGVCIHLEKANEYYSRLMNNVRWEKDIAIIFGKRIETKRKVAWYGDKAYEYTYSKNTKLALPWNDVLLELKNLTELITGVRYNSCLANLYHDGNEGMAWHSDNERDLKENAAIASLSFGAERRFSFKHKNSGEKVSLLLEHGSILVMKDVTQKNWLHRLPPTKKELRPRINLTFRTIDTQ